jgi:chromate transporter
MPAEDRTSLVELGSLFLRLGATAFGGPAAHIALMNEEVVRRRRWMDEARFLDLLGATNLIPGPNSTEMALHIGWERRGAWGLLVAGFAFILPAAAITAVLAWIYLRFGTIPEARGILYGIKPVMLAIVFQAIVMLVPKAASSWRLRALGVAALIAAALGVHELVVLFGAGAAAAFAAGVRPPARAAVVVAPLVLGALAPSASAAGLFAVFLKIGSVIFGSGYVLLAFLRADLVERLGWLTEAQLIDAIAVGQVTPGPVFTTATFIGYLLAGIEGAFAATAGIFLPGFILVALSGPLVPKLRGSRLAGSALDGVNVASLALMVVVTTELARAAVVDVPAAILGVLALVLLRRRVNATWLIAGGAVAGWGAEVISRFAR